MNVYLHSLDDGNAYIDSKVFLFRPDAVQIKMPAHWGK